MTDARFSSRKLYVLVASSLALLCFQRNREIFSSLLLLLADKVRKKKRQKKAKETKEEKSISVEDLTGYDDIVCEFALGTFHLLDRVVSFSQLLI